MVVAHVILDTMMMEIILHANNAIAIAKNVLLEIFPIVLRVEHQIIGH